MSQCATTLRLKRVWWCHDHDNDFQWVFLLSELSTHPSLHIQLFISLERWKIMECLFWCIMPSILYACTERHPQKTWYRTQQVEKKAPKRFIFCILLYFCLIFNLHLVVFKSTNYLNLILYSLKTTSFCSDVQH